MATFEKSRREWVKPGGPPTANRPEVLSGLRIALAASQELEAAEAEHSEQARKTRADDRSWYRQRTTEISSANTVGDDVKVDTGVEHRWQIERTERGIMAARSRSRECRGIDNAAIDIRADGRDPTGREPGCIEAAQQRGESGRAGEPDPEHA